VVIFLLKTKNTSDTYHLLKNKGIKK